MPFVAAFMVFISIKLQYLAATKELDCSREIKKINDSYAVSTVIVKGREVVGYVPHTVHSKTFMEKIKTCTFRLEND